MRLSLSKYGLERKREKKIKNCNFHSETTSAQHFVLLNAKIASSSMLLSGAAAAAAASKVVPAVFLPQSKMFFSPARSQTSDLVSVFFFFSSQSHVCLHSAPHAALLAEPHVSMTPG